ncbi:glycoside hydrolase family 76 protein [Arthrobacter sp. ISL-30]|uniref:glycoside hydrolase family 76 protein n=1 Tax=Arthrobacter sp. ISL-30 TaxID=2819109 RepID=UPI001BE73D8E|nr:glycoside hydrolase family 76 protein [Arthrobacter sp. ISL-30]MBT2515299.1 glycosyl hydrolase [Arthrobacter sp. ISL-30]
MPRPEDVPRLSGEPSSGEPAPADRATAAARAVTRHFGQRLPFLPWTHLGAVAHPSNRLQNLFRPWHYWWQAHYLDCLVDTGFRELATGTRFDGGLRPSAGRLASRLVTGIRLRNLLRFTNSYYDDMAWFALSTQRLQKLADQSRKPGRRRNDRIRRRLSLEFDSASTDDLGGGTFWSIKRDFKNTPATAPVALYFARSGYPDKAQALVDWLNARLFDADRGLYLDGIRISNGQEILEEGVYTYNQGPILGAFLELGGERNLDRAAVVVAAVDRHLTVPAVGVANRLLRCDGTGDGGLFTGILARYLALAAADPRLPATTRATAKRLVTDTAEAFWAGRMLRPERAEKGRTKAPDWLVFSVHAQLPAAETYPPGSAVELSTQLQAWMTLEAAATLT